MSDTMNDKLKQKLAATGGLTSADLAAAPIEDIEEEQGPQIGTVVTSAPEDDFNDPLLDSEPKHTTDGEMLSDMVGGVDRSSDMIDVEITEEEREAFIDAMVRGDRFCLPFSITGGRITGKIRSRKHKETTVILSQIQREIRDQSITVDVEYMSRLRSMTLAAQIESYNDEEEAVLAAPLAWTRDSAGVLQPPGWLKQTDHWDNIDEGLAILLHEEVRKFEVKYWMLVRQAEDQNFWKPATST